jgi:hypothetical protein
MTAGQRTTQILKAVTEPFTSFPFRFNDWLGKFPSTNGRIFFTIVAMMITTARYCLGAGGTDQWEPSGEWLSFLAVMAGVDTLHFLAKRKTHESPTSGQELPQP